MCNVQRLRAMHIFLILRTSFCYNVHEVKEMAENYELAQIDYNDGLKYKEIADKYGVTLNTVRSWKSRKWSEKGKMKRVARDVQEEHKRLSEFQKSAQIDFVDMDTIKTVLGKERDATELSNVVPNVGLMDVTRTEAMRKVYERWLPQEQLDIIDTVSSMSIADRLWMQLEFNFSSLVRMQQIMYVNDNKDHTSVISGIGMSETYAVALAHDKYDKYVTAQAKATNAYLNIVRMFLEVAELNDERRLKLEAMTLGNEKLRAEIEKIKGVDNDKPLEIIIKKKEV